MSEIRRMFEAARAFKSDPAVAAGQVRKAMLDRRAPGFYVVDDASGFVIAGPFKEAVEATLAGEQLGKRSGGRVMTLSQVIDHPV